PDSLRHPRESGVSVGSSRQLRLGSRFRGNDELGGKPRLDRAADLLQPYCPASRGLRFEIMLDRVALVVGNQRCVGAREVGIGFIRSTISGGIVISARRSSTST